MDFRDFSDQSDFSDLTISDLEKMIIDAENAIFEMKKACRETYGEGHPDCDSVGDEIAELVRAIRAEIKKRMLADL